MRFAGYAAIFDVEDRGGDVVRRGAFAGASREVPLLWQHRPGEPIGRIAMIAEDRRGLRVIGDLPDDAPAAEALRAGAVTGLSFGYRVKGARGSRPRELTALDLVEVSLVAMPMQPLARVHAVEGCKCEESSGSRYRTDIKRRRSCS
ncbi:MAG: HK97 family phage prohead protease [Sphingomonas sanxanigenens]|uniref:HK97 family phage prohead protease n=1 Tax=Sphingomonas sanxanigenens TaxID=397260 RepID=A0A2W5C872_9SPHN|nr:MAG: HK97 family phage prohead protease [Sphingomonas sanxanigenens]